MKNKKIIISIVLLTYNSEKTVVATLNSILDQGYCLSDIEIVISDDGSTDDTINIISDWLTINELKFFNVQFLVNKINLGVSANVKQAYEAATSEWIKPIAGDDTLAVNCLTDNVEYIKQHPDCKFLFSYSECFSLTDSEFKIKSPEPITTMLFELSSAEQFKVLQKTNFPIAPTAFLNKQAVNDVGGVDINFRNVDDYPLWYQATKHGYKLHFLNAITVRYCIGESISQTQSLLIPLRSFQGWIEIQRKLILPDVSKIRVFKRIDIILYPLLVTAIASFFNNKKTRLSCFLINITRIFRPPFFLRNFNKLKFKFKNTTKHKNK